MRRTWASVVRGGWSRLERTMAAAPGIRQVRRLAHAAEFAHGRPMNGYLGVYTSFAEAARAAPPGAPLGYDDDSMAGLYTGTIGALNPADYPVLFWLRQLIGEARGVLDFGGHVGLAYYGYRRYVDFPTELRWTVCDVPAVVRAGRRLAVDLGATSLAFTEQVGDGDGCDILLAAGSLQYVEEGFLHRALAAFRRRPRHVIVQRTPFHDTRSFVTLQATGPAFCPYTVAHRGAFVQGLTSLGYELVDSWQLPRALNVPLEPECHVPAYSGLYFRIRQDAPETV